MKRNKKETRYVSVLVVHVPDAEALIDMLRYDRCCPATEGEAHKVMRMIGGSATPADYIVRLHRFAAANLPATEGRWRSFGCTVLDERSPEETSPTDDEIRRMAAIAGCAIVLDYCPICKAGPLHATESDDLGRCKSCSVVSKD